MRDDLFAQTARLLTDPGAREALSTAAKSTVHQALGATSRHADRIPNLLPVA